MSNRFYGYDNKCLILNKRDDLKQRINYDSYEYKIWNIMTTATKKNQKTLKNSKYQNLKNYRLKLLKIAKLIDDLKDLKDGDHKKFSNIEFIAPLFIKNPQILIDNLYRYNRIRNFILKIIKDTDYDYDYEDKDKETGILFDLFKDKVIEDEEAKKAEAKKAEDKKAKDKKAKRAYTVYSLNNRFYPQLRKFEVYKNIEKDDFNKLMNESGNHKFFKFTQNELDKSINKNFKSIYEPNCCNKYYKLSLQLGYLEKAREHLRNYFLKNKQLIGIKKKIDSKFCQQLISKEIPNDFFKEKQEVEIQKDTELETEIINFLKDSDGDGDADTIKKKILNKISQIEKLDFSIKSVRTEYYKYKGIFLYLNKDDVFEMRNYINDKDDNQDVLVAYYENKIFQEIFAESDKKYYTNLGEEIKGSIINIPQYKEISYFDSLENELNRIKETVSDNNFKFKLINILKNKLHDKRKLEDITEENLKKIIKDYSTYDFFYNKTQEGVKKLLSKFYNEIYFDKTDYSVKVFTIDKDNREIRKFIKKHIGWDSNISPKNMLDINHITKKVTYNLQNSLQSSIEITEKNTDVDASKYNNLSLSVGNLGGNERKNWDLTLNDNSIMILQEVFYDKGTELTTKNWYDEHDYLISKNDNENILNYIGNEIPDDNLLSIKLSKSSNLHHGCCILYGNNITFIKKIKPSYKKEVIFNEKKIFNRTSDWILLQYNDMFIATISIHLQVVESLYTFCSNIYIIESLKKDVKYFQDKNIPCIIGGDFQKIIFKNNILNILNKLNIDKLFTNFSKISPEDSIDHIDHIFCTKDLLKDNITITNLVEDGVHKIFSLQLPNTNIDSLIKKNKSETGIQNFGKSDFADKINNTFSNNSFNGTFSVSYQYKKKYPNILKQLDNYENNYENSDELEIKKLSDNKYGVTKYSYYQRTNNNNIESLLSNLLEN